MIRIWHKFCNIIKLNSKWGKALKQYFLKFLREEDEFLARKLAVMKQQPTMANQERIKIIFYHKIIR